MPLHLDENQATTLSNEVMNKQIDDVRKAYDNKVTEIGNTNLKKFNDLTVAQRTVISSVYFQYGSTGRFPIFWSHVTNQRWSHAISELRNFGDDFSTRRNLEADLLENDSGKTTLCSRCKRSANNVCEDVKSVASRRLIVCKLCLYVCLFVSYFRQCFLLYVN
ncbi:uncharacterized protein LOC144362825 [Saccoglossus kowalevskii]